MLSPSSIVNDCGSKDHFAVGVPAVISEGSAGASAGFHSDPPGFELCSDINCAGDLHRAHLSVLNGSIYPPCRPLASSVEQMRHFSSRAMLRLTDWVSARRRLWFAVRDRSSDVTIGLFQWCAD